MKLTPKDVGKLIRHEAWDSGMYTKVQFIGKSYIVGIEQNGSECTYENDDSWEYYKKPKKEWFDFKRFGCNVDHVRDLVEALDKRYKHKAKKKVKKK